MRGEIHDEFKARTLATSKLTVVEVFIKRDLYLLIKMNDLNNLPVNGRHKYSIV